MPRSGRLGRRFVVAKASSDISTSDLPVTLERCLPVWVIRNYCLVSIIGINTIFGVHGSYN